MPTLLLVQPKVGIDVHSPKTLPPLALGIVAACTPANWKVKLLDENIEPLDLTRSTDPADLVGITSLTHNINRAYEIAQHYRSQGTKVIIGGPHASLCPDEVLQHSDSVAIGEAEGIWTQVIADVENGSLQNRYVSKNIDAKDIRAPRRDLFSSVYEMDGIQTARGCPFRCEFCCVHSLYGNTYRQRSTEDILEELKTLKRSTVFFVDDNLIGTTKAHEARALDLFNKMATLKPKRMWVTQVSINFAKNDEVLRAAYRSGCRGVVIGIESPDRRNLKQLNKGHNIFQEEDGMRKAIANIHKHGIAVIGVFILGNDFDTPSSFGQILSYIRSIQLDCPEFQFLTPYPGTQLIERLKQENRLLVRELPRDWARCEENILLIPRNITIRDLVRGHDVLISKLFTLGSVLKRAMRTLLLTRRLSTALFMLMYGYGARRFYWEEWRRLDCNVRL